MIDIHAYCSLAVLLERRRSKVWFEDVHSDRKTNGLAGWLSCSFSKLAPIGATLPIFLIWTISSLLRHSIRLEYVPTLPPNQPPRALMLAQYFVVLGLWRLWVLTHRHRQKFIDPKLNHQLDRSIVQGSCSLRRHSADRDPRSGGQLLSTATLILAGLSDLRAAREAQLPVA